MQSRRGSIPQLVEFSTEMKINICFKATALLKACAWDITELKDPAFLKKHEWRTSGDIELHDWARLVMNARCNEDLLSFLKGGK